MAVAFYGLSLNDYFERAALATGFCSPEKRAILGKNRVGRALFWGFGSTRERTEGDIAEKLAVLGIGNSTEDARRAVPLLAMNGFEYEGRLGAKYRVVFEDVPSDDGEKRYRICARRFDGKA